MKTIIRAVLPDGSAVDLPSFETVAVSRVVSIMYSPNTDPEDDNEGELTLTVEIDDRSLIEATERAQYYGHLASCAIVAVPLEQQTTRTRCDCGKGAL